MAVDLTTIRGVIELSDRFSGPLLRAANAMDHARDRVETFGRVTRTLGAALAPMSAAISGVAVAAAKFGTEFDSAMTKVETLVGLARDQVEGFKGAVLDLAGETGKAPRELADALFTVTSAGVRGSEALEILEQAAKASASGLGETREIARAVTAAVQAYGVENLSAARATDIMFATVREGNLAAEELAPSLGRVIGIAAQVGVTFDQVGAFVATFTRLGVDAAEAVTSLRGVLATVLNPTKEAEKALRAAGSSIDDLRDAIRERGLTSALNELVTLFQGNEERLSLVIPNIRALSGVLGTAGRQGEQFAQIQQSISQSLGAVNQGFARTTEEVDFQWSRMWARLQAAAIRGWNALQENAQLVVRVMDGIGDAADRLVEAFQRLDPEARKVVVTILGVVAAAGPALLAIGVAAGPIASALGLILRGLAALVSPLGVVSGLMLGAAAALISLAGDANRAVASVSLLGGPLTSLRFVVREVRDGVDRLRETLANLIPPQLPGMVSSVWRIFVSGLTIIGEMTLGPLRDALREVSLLLGRMGEAIERLRSFTLEPWVRANLVPLTLLRVALDRLSDAAPLDASAASLGRLAEASERAAERVRQSGAAVEGLARPLATLIPRAAQAGDAVGGIVAPLRGLGEESGVVSGVLQAQLVPRVAALSDELAELRDKLTGADTAKALADLVTVWRTLTAQQRANEAIIVRVLDAYERLRLDAIQPLPPELERLRAAWVQWDEAIERNQDAILRLQSLLPEMGSGLNRGIIAPGTLAAATLRDLAEAGSHAAGVLAEWMHVTTALIGHLAEAAERTSRETQEALHATRTWAADLGFLADAFQQLAQIADGSLGRVVRMIGTVIAALELARKAGEDFAAALKAADIRGAIGAGFGGAAGVIQATQHGSTAGRVLGGAAAGAQFGSAFGPVGTVIGAAAGGVVGLFRGLVGKSEGRKRLEEANKQIEELRQGLLRTHGSLARIRELGGALGLDLAGLWGSQNVQGLREFSEAAKQFEERLKAIGEEMQRLAHTGDVASVELAKFRDALRDDPAVVDFIRGQVEIVGRSVKDFLDNATILTQGGADAIGQMLLLAWDGTTKGLASLFPLLEQYRQQLEAAGFTAGEGFARFREMAALAADEVRGPLLRAINAGTAGLVAMFNAGLLTQETFAGMVGEIMAQRQALIDSGAAADVVNAAMQRDLQRIWELTHLHGLKVDENTQALLDEAEASGLVGKQFVNATDRIVAAVERLVELFEAAFGTDLPNAIRDGAKKAADELERQLPHEFPIRVKFTVEGDAAGTLAPEGRQHGSPGLRFERWGSGTLAMLHGDEAVVTREQGESLAALLTAAVSRAAGPSGEMVVHVPVQIDAMRVADVVARVHPRSVALRGA